MSDAALRAYLLGKLTESELELIENRLVEDADLFSQMETAEDDLFDAFARGRLDGDEQARFLERFGADQRRQFAEAFVKRTSSARVPFVRRRWVELAVAASLAIGVGAFLIPRGPAINESPDVPASVPTVAVPVAPTVSTVSLALGSSRAAGAATHVAIAPAAAQIDFRIRLNPADKYAAYAAEIRSQADTVVWGGVVRPASEGGELIAHAMVPAAQLTAGTYEIAIRGGASAASLDDLGFVTIEVGRQQ